MLRRLSVIIILNLSMVLSQQRCTSDFKHGRQCSQSSPSTKWFFDSKMAFCYPYQFLGCDEGDNSFNSQDECLSECKPADQFSCGGNSDGAGVCFSPNDGGCKKGNICVMGGNLGFCCNKDNQEKWNAEQSPKCVQGETVHIDMWFGKTPLIGRNCSHKFCPAGSKCIQGKWTAHCCK